MARLRSFMKNEDKNHGGVLNGPLGAVIRPVIIFISTVISILIIVATYNIYLVVTQTGEEAVFAEWTLNRTIYSPRYIYWGKSVCEQSTKNCIKPEDKYLTHQLEVFGSDNNGVCTAILFLGDSFTFAPWMKKHESYAEVFSGQYSTKKNTCVILYRVATGGASNDQELARFSDVVEFLHPDIVFWQFYFNDLYENVQSELYQSCGDTVCRRNAYFNTRFISGFLNQKIPFLRNTTIGKHLMFLGEFKDVFRVWPVDIYNTPDLFNYNKRKIPLLLNVMERLSRTNRFDFFTSLAPLECEQNPAADCASHIVEQMELRRILQSNSRYISTDRAIDDNKYILGAYTAINNPPLFGPDRDSAPPGSRHLTSEGNRVYGSILFENYWTQAPPH